jgi:hypothetical protein
MIVGPSASGGPSSSVWGSLNLTVVANNSGTSQRGMMELTLMGTSSVFGRTQSVLGNYVSRALTIDSGVAQTLGATVQISAADPSAHITTDGYVTEKIT